MVRGIADPRGQFLKPQRFLGRLDQRDGFGHCDPVAAHFVGLAAQACTVAGVPRGICIGIEDHMQRDRTKPVLAPVPALPRLISRLP